MRRRTVAGATAVALTLTCVAAPSARAESPSPNVNAKWPSPGANVSDWKKEKPLPISGAPVSLQPDAGRHPLVVVENDQEKGGKSFTIPADVLFDTDSAKLSGNANANLNEVVSKLKAASVTGQVKIIGHTDDTGSKAHNLSLSKQRAQAVDTALYDKLRSSGITLKSSGVGEKDPLVKNDSAAHRARNRRVAIVYNTSSTNTSSDDQYDISVPLTQPATKPSGVPPATGAIASGVRDLSVDNETVKLRLNVLGLTKQDGLIRADVQTEVLSQPGTNTYSGIYDLFTGSTDPISGGQIKALLYDAGKKQQLEPLITGKGDQVADIGDSGDGESYGTGGLRPGYIYFPAPTTGATKLSLYVPAFGSFENLPVK